ncbi:MAG: putative transcriptional regulator, Crp/Fnr family [Myxococcales bacterium]|nr:putative transcriptional regulator, Crp/Fnr family [Myxococcales bacterium]
MVNAGDRGPTGGELRTITLFHGFGDEELRDIGALFTRVEIDPKTPLFDLHEPATTFYLLTKGEVTLDRPGDDLFRLHPPALIGELGALTALPRSTRALVTAGSTVWALPAKKIQAYLSNHQELGVRFLVNLLTTVADKVHRDQVRMADMRQNLMKTQKELKRMRELVLESPETPLSAPVHDSLDRLITNNRRVNYRVEPPAALAASVRFEAGDAPVADISRTHISVNYPVAPPPVGTWLSGVAHLASTDIAISGKIMRVTDRKVTLELDLMIDEFAAALEGYLTRLQLLDILC